MNLQDIIKSRIGLGAAIGIGRSLPPAIGYPLVNSLAKIIASRRNSPLVRAVRANQWVITREKLSADQLDQAVQDTFRHTAHCLYNFFRTFNNPQALLERIEFGPRIKQYIERTKQGKEGMVIVGLHLSNFDLVAQAAAQLGLRALALGIPESDAAVRWQNDMRRNFGLEIIPASMKSIRSAMKRLRSGESVITGIDRPIPESKYRPIFFDRPVSLPVIHIHLALKAKVPVIVAAAIMQPDGIYHILASDLIYMKPHPNRHEEIIQNAETVLRVVEDYIRQVPTQWTMTLPVWPEAQDEMP